MEMYSIRLNLKEEDYERINLPNFEWRMNVANIPHCLQWGTLFLLLQERRGSRIP